MFYRSHQPNFFKETLKYVEEDVRINYLMKIFSFLTYFNIAQPLNVFCYSDFNIYSEILEKNLDF